MVYFEIIDLAHSIAPVVRSKRHQFGLRPNTLTDMLTKSSITSSPRLRGGSLFLPNCNALKKSHPSAILRNRDKVES